MKKTTIIPLFIGYHRKTYFFILKCKKIKFIIEKLYQFLNKQVFE